MGFGAGRWRLSHPLGPSHGNRLPVRGADAREAAHRGRKEGWPHLTAPVDRSAPDAHSWKKMRLLEVVMDMSSRRTTGIAGTVFVALAIAIVILSGDADFSRDDAALEDFFVRNTRQAQAFTAVVLLPLAAAALLWFVAGIRTLLRAGDDGGGMLPSAAGLGGGVFAATFLVGMTTSNSVAAALAFTDAYQFDAGIARLTLILGIILTTASLAGAAVLVVATSLAGQRSGLMPTWLSRAGYVVAVLALFSVLLFAWPIALVGLWMLTLSIMLLRGPKTIRTAERPVQRADESPTERPRGPEVIG